jgi:hypothetical protein
MAQAPTVQAAPASAHTKNTRRAENRSAMASKANTSVPTMKPNCSAEVSAPTAEVAQPSSRCKSGMTAFTANHNEVPANCAATNTGRMWRGTAGWVMARSSQGRYLFVSQHAGQLAKV